MLPAVPATFGVRDPPPRLVEFAQRPIGNRASRNVERDPTLTRRRLTTWSLGYFSASAISVCHSCNFRSDLVVIGPIVSESVPSVDGKRKLDISGNRKLNTLGVGAYPQAGVGLGGAVGNWLGDATADESGGDKPVIHSGRAARLPFWPATRSSRLKNGLIPPTSSATIERHCTCPWLSRSSPASHGSHIRPCQIGEARPFQVRHRLIQTADQLLADYLIEPTFVAQGGSVLPVYICLRWHECTFLPVSPAGVEWSLHARGGARARPIHARRGRRDAVRRCHCSAAAWRGPVPSCMWVCLVARSGTARL